MVIRGCDRAPQVPWSCPDDGLLQPSCFLPSLASSLLRRDLLKVEQAELVGDDDVQEAVTIDVHYLELRPNARGLFEIDVVAVPVSTPVGTELVIDEYSRFARALAAGAMRPLAFSGN